MKRDYFWNTLAGLMCAAEAVIMSSVVTRTTGLKDAGYLTIAFAVCNLLLTIGKYGVYPFQVTDISDSFSFFDYLSLRIITMSVMALSLVIYIFYSYIFLCFPLEKIAVIALIGLIYFIEAGENLIIGHCHLKGKLYLGARCYVFRWLFIFFIFSGIIIWSNSVILALLLSAIGSLIVLIAYFILYKIPNIPKNASLIQSFRNRSQLFKLLKTCFPLFISAFFSFYISNLPKYTLDKFVIPEVIACYGFVAMPVFTIDLINSFFFSPKLVTIAEEYKSTNKKPFYTRIRNQLLLILATTIVAIGSAYLLGIPVLSFIYNTDLTNYKIELIILLVCGGFFAITNFQTAILITMRKQKYILYGYIPVIIFELLLVNPMVKYFSTKGAAITYLITMMMLSCIYFIPIKK